MYWKKFSSERSDSQIMQRNRSDSQITQRNRFFTSFLYKILNPELNFVWYKNIWGNKILDITFRATKGRTRFSSRAQGGSRRELFLHTVDCLFAETNFISREFDYECLKEYWLTVKNTVSCSSFKHFLRILQKKELTNAKFQLWSKKLYSVNHP